MLRGSARLSASLFVCRTGDQGRGLFQVVLIVRLSRGPIVPFRPVDTWEQILGGFSEDPLYRTVDRPGPLLRPWNDHFLVPSRGRNAPVKTTVEGSILPRSFGTLSSVFFLALHSQALTS